MLGVAPPSTPTRSPLVGAPLAALSRSGALSYEGATLGPYKGRVTAVGGTIGYNFTLGRTPTSTRLKVLRGVEVENRFRGTIGFLQVSFPLWVPPQTSAPATQPTAAKF